VGSASNDGDDSARSVSKLKEPSGGLPTTITCARRRNAERSIAANSPNSAALITSTRAPLSFSAY
jgi:hypothetical protein